MNWLWQTTVTYSSPAFPLWGNGKGASHWFALLNPISYLLGANKHNWQWNPEKWDWSQAFFRIGVKTENHGLQVYLGYGWDPNFVPTVNYDSGKGVGAGVSGANGNNGAYFPGYNPPTAEEVVLKKINEVRQVYGAAWRWLDNAGTAGSMFYDWLTGTGPTTRTFSNDNVSGAMRDAYRVNQARDFFYNKYEGVSNYKGASVTNFDGSFGLMGPLHAGFDPIEQYVGSYTVNITSNGKSLNFSLYNNTSFESFFYGFGSAWSRSKFGPGGNMYQYYNWSEPLIINK